MTRAREETCGRNLGRVGSRRPLPSEGCRTRPGRNPLRPRATSPKCGDKNTFDMALSTHFRSEAKGGREGVLMKTLEVCAAPPDL